MIKVIIKTNSQQYSASFSTQEEAEAWVKKHKGVTEESIIEYVNEHEYDRDRKMADLRQDRDEKLLCTDWLMMPDVRYPQKHKKIYLEYRQYMRDITHLLQPTEAAVIEPFENWLRRKYPEEFLDGGESAKIIHRFTYYYSRYNLVRKG